MFISIALGHQRLHTASSGRCYMSRQRRTVCARDWPSACSLWQQLMCQFLSCSKPMAHSFDWFFIVAGVCTSCTVQDCVVISLQCVCPTDVRTLLVWTVRQLPHPSMRHLRRHFIAVCKFLAQLPMMSVFCWLPARAVYKCCRHCRVDGRCRFLILIVADTDILGANPGSDCTLCGFVSVVT